MSEFKIESGIPIPDEPDFTPEDIIPEEEPSRWVPFKPHQKKCLNHKHSPAIGRCTLCGDIFPCPSGNCGHADCRDPSLSGLDCKGNGTDVPDFVKEALIASGQWREPVA